MEITKKSELVSLEFSCNIFRMTYKVKVQEEDKKKNEQQ